MLNYRICLKYNTVSPHPSLYLLQTSNSRQGTHSTSVTRAHPMESNKEISGNPVKMDGTISLTYQPKSTLCELY